MKRDVLIRTEPYVRVHPGTGTLLWSGMRMNGWMARRVAERLLRAADRLDPKREHVAPWKEKTK